MPIGLSCWKSDEAISFINSCRIAKISRNNLRPKFSFHGQDKCQFEEREKIVYDSFVSRT